MRDLILFAQSGEVRDLVATLTGEFANAPDALLGVLVDVHPLWQHLWWSYSQGLRSDSELHREFRNLVDWLDYAPYLLSVSALERLPWWSPPMTTREVHDFGWQPEWWKRYCEENNRRPDPFVIRLHVRPLKKDERSILDGIRRIAGRAPYFVIVEYREPARLAATTQSHVRVQSGTRLDGAAPGTLGGFVKDQSGNILAMTCGHIAQQAGDPADLVDVRGKHHRKAGTCTWSTFANMHPLPTQALCNATIPNPNTVDAALVDLDARFVGRNLVPGLGPVDDIFDETQLSSGQWLTMYGGHSGAGRYKLGGYGIVYRFKFKGLDYCFHHLFELKVDLSGPLPMSVKLMSATIPLDGDSGTWVCVSSPRGNAAFAGMLLGVDQLSGYAQFTNVIIAAAASHQLSLP